MLAKSSFAVSVVALLLSVGFTFFSEYFKEPGVAYVNSAHLIQNYEGMKEAVKVYQSKATVWQANIDTLAGELSEVIEDYEKRKNTLTSAERELTEKLIQTKRQQLLDYQKAISEKAQDEDQKMTSAVMEQINNFVKRYGEEHEYELIMGATQAGNLVYAKEGLDITEKVLEGLNAEYQQGRIKNN